MYDCDHYISLPIMIHYKYSSILLRYNSITIIRHGGSVNQVEPLLLSVKRLF